MQQFVQDLLNYARVESEARPLEPVALDDVAREVCTWLNTPTAPAPPAP